MENIKEILKKYKQEHLLMFYDSLSFDEKQQFLNEISNINFEEIMNMRNVQETVKLSQDIKPVKSVLRSELLPNEVRELEERGRGIIKNGNYAVVTMAGGQGTRLGHNGPKGTYSLKLWDKEKFIFEIFVDYLKEIYKKYGVFLCWYIMTSRENNSDTINFFEVNSYFGYPKEKIKFFMQGELPITDMEGNLLLESKSKLLKAADGNGGVFNALSNVLQDMKENKIQWVLITGVDNILVNLADELFIGLVDKENNLNGVKSVSKEAPEERVGVFCKRNGKPSVIEYTEMDESMRYGKDENGKLRFIEANIVNHLINIQVLDKIQNEKLPIHKAVKKMPYIDKQGRMQNPSIPCLIKYEAFIFDYFNKVDDVTILRVEREKEFAPVKNKEGADSPETAIKLFNMLHSKEV